MSKVELLEKDLRETKQQCAELQRRCDHHQAEMFVVNAKRIKAEKEVAKLRMELALLKEGILM